MNKPELLAPAGNLEKLKTAINFGADAVYLGGSKLNLRAFADNFSDEDLLEGLRYAHDRGKKVYVTVNVFPHNDDLVGLEEYLKELYSIGVDALIVSDPGVISTSRVTVPGLELHLSTQANTVNWKTAEFWYKQGVKRIVLAREMSMEEVREIKRRVPEGCEIEAFVHGSMCMSYSGRCVISSYMTGRDSNRGECAQPCRYKYYITEEKRPGEYFPIVEDNRGTYLLNSKDMCMIEHIPDLVESGIDSFKIEGRMKSSFYVACIVKPYRQAIDSYFENPEEYTVKQEWIDNLLKASHRKYFTGFYYNDPDRQIFENSSYIRDYDIVGIVRGYEVSTGTAVVEQRNKVFDGDSVDVLSPVGSNFSVTIKDLRNEEGNKIEAAPVAQMIYKFSADKKLTSGDMLVKKKK
ncbi:MAG TPA: U32 family peptidase [Clostridiaceae bacterium]